MFGDIIPPITNIGNVLRPDGACCFADKTFDPRTVRQFDRAYGQRGRDANDEFPYSCFG